MRESLLELFLVTNWTIDLITLFCENHYELHFLLKTFIFTFPYKSFGNQLLEFNPF